jgi:putative ABC transport system permease protein
MKAWLSRMVRRARALWRRESLERELDAEMREHIDLEAQDIARTQGVGPAEARRRALVAFGGVARYTEDHRDARGTRWLEELVQDVRYAGRSLRRSAGFTLSSVLVLALGIGATTAVFSAVNAVLVDPDYDRLAIVYQQFSPTSRGTLSVVDFRAIEDQQRSFSDVGALRGRMSSFSAGDEPVQLPISAATSGFFRAFGVRPLRGRAIEPGDERQGAPAVALASYALAERALGGAATAVGRSVTIDGIAHTVVGVLPAGVRELAGVRAELWSALQLAQPTRRGPFGLWVVARLKPGVTFDAAERDLAGISERIFPLWATGFQNSAARLNPVPMRTAILGEATTRLGMFGAAVGLVLLIAVANVASLMLVRAIGRWREVSLRAVLGASRARLVRLLVTESIMLSAAGAAVGIAVGALGLRALIAIGPSMPHLAGAQLDLRAVGFGVAVALLAGVIVGAYPVALLLRRDTSGALQLGERTIGGGRHTHAVRSAFVVAQFALALPILAIAGLLLNSFARLQREEPGFDPRRILTVRVSLPGARYSASDVVAGYWARALPLLRQIPGVLEVGLGSMMPPNDFGSGNNNNFDLVDHPVPPGSVQPNAPWPAVNGEYFAALGVPLLDGRLFAPADTGGPAPVVVVSRSWARRYFPEGAVVGRKLISGGCVSCPLTTVIGVVGDVRYAGLDGAPDAVYGPLSEGWERDLNLFVRTAASPTEVAARVRAALRSLDPGVPLDDVASMEDRLYASIAQPRHWTAMLGGFAAAALVLAAVGIFGMLSYTVRTRHREIGVRMALGARRQAVVGMVVRRGLFHAIVGTALGLVIALVATRSLAASLFGVSPTDPATLAAVTLILLAVALIACWFPARRAAAIDPVNAIRVD